jgi:hypothetical protein
MSNIILAGPEKWGSLAWHLLHSFSMYNKKISDKNISRYYIFYTCFIQIIPCKICSIHYEEIINYIIPLDKNKITRNYLKYWIYEVHNLVNEYLNKKKNISYKKCIQFHSNILHRDIIFFLNIVYLNFDYNNMSIYEFDKIQQFFINFCYLYPDAEIRNKLKKEINNKKFKNIYSSIEFKKWYIKLNIMKFIS